MVDSKHKRPTIYLADDEAKWVAASEQEYGIGKSTVIRALVRAGMQNPELIAQNVEGEQ